MSSDTRQGLWDIFTDAVQTFDKKNEDYGDAWRRNGWRGNLSRIFEKADRVRNLAWRPDPRVPAVGDEQVVDTLKDMLNTIAFAIMNLEEEVEYGHEIPRSRRLDHLAQDYVPGQATTFYDQVSAELPHRVSLGTHIEPSTEHIHVDVSPEALEQAKKDGYAVAATVAPQSFQTGPDEQSAVEKKHEPQRRKSARTVTDSPQA